MPRKKRELLPEVGARIRQARTALGLSQQELGKRIGKTASAVSKYERGQITEVRALAAISKVLGKPADWLLHGDSPESPGRATAASVPLPEPVGELAALLLPERSLERVRRLPPRYRGRYLDRVKEVAARVRRELDEYRKVLEAEYLAERARRRNSK
jgi:transcriptional regulator with XRE-family HTH domain